MAIDHNAQKSIFLDTLYCDEVAFQDHGDNDDDDDDENLFENKGLGPNQVLIEQDLLWDDEELESLFVREKETFFITPKSQGRKEAVEWILKVNSHYGFSALTAILAVNYLDRFLATLSFQEDKQPWVLQLAAVTCLSLAAKVEETCVPLLLDLQVFEAEYVFEAKTIQKAELGVLSSLKWRMNPATPISFIDHIIRRLGLKCYVHWEFLHRCESLLLTVLSDSRVVCYLPSVLATATMLHVIHQVDYGNGIDYENQLLGILKMSKDEVDDCYEFIASIISGAAICAKTYPQKRKLDEIPDSPNGVTDAMFTSDSSNDSWGIASSSPPLKIFKKSRVKEQPMRLPSKAEFLWSES